MAKRIREDIAHYATKKVWGENYDSSYREHQLMLRKIEDLRDSFGRALMEAKGKSGDGKRAFMFVGVSKNGVREYKSDFPKNMSPAKRVEEFKKRIQSVVNLGQVKLQTDTKKFVVVADKFTKTKNIFGDDDSAGFEIETKINALYDIVDMLNSSTYINKNTEDSYDPITNAPREDVPPKNKAHEGVKYWYWFKNTIKFDGQLYDVIFNICDKGKEQILYLAKFTALEDNAQKNSTSESNPTTDNGLRSKISRTSTNKSISPTATKSNKQTVNNSSNKGLSLSRANTTPQNELEAKMKAQALSMYAGSGT